MPYYKTEGDQGFALIDNVFGTFVVLLILAGMMLVGAPVLVSIFSKYECRCEVTKLVALTDSVKEEGRFFLTSESIHEKPYYVFYQENGKAIIFDKVPAEKAKIYEEERNDATVERCSLVWKGWKIHPTPINPNCEGIRFRVPRGTIVKSYNLDLRRP